MDRGLECCFYSINMKKNPPTDRVGVRPQFYQFSGGKVSVDTGVGLAFVVTSDMTDSTDE